MARDWFWETGYGPTFVTVCLGAIFAVACLMYAVGMAAMRLALPGDLAAIEQLRGDIARSPCQIGEDVLGQATAINQAIRSTQRYNDIWWSDPIIPDRWDDVQVIQIPTCEGP